MDISLIWNQDFADISFNESDIVMDDSLKTAIMISLFTDKRVNSEKGVWFDSFEQEEFGSRLWLIDREKIQGQIPLRANEYASEALKWLIVDGVVKSIKVDSYLDSNNTLQIPISVTKPDGTVTRFEFVWSAIKKV